jgi:hypothetical protein
MAATVLGEVPTVRTIKPIGLQRGTSVEVQLSGDELGTAHQIVFFTPGLEAKDIKAVDNRNVKFTLHASPDAACDLHAFRVVTQTGISNLRLLSVSPLPSAAEVEPNNRFDEAQLIALNTTVQGAIDPEDVDHFVVEVPQGEMISVEMEGLRHNYLNNMFDPFVAIYDDQGNELTSNDDASLVQQDCICSVIAPKAGRYVIEVRDASYGGSRDSVYRLHLGNYARPLAIYPSGGRPGETLQATCVDALGNTWEESFVLPKEPDPRFRVWSHRGQTPTPSPNYLRVNHLENVLEVEPNNDYKEVSITSSLPAAFNGCLQTPGDRDWFVFSAKKGQAFEVRLVARQFIRSPVDGVVDIYKVGGSRVASSDDAGGPDSAISFKAPEDGNYAIGVRDHLSAGGPQFVYRLEIDQPTPRLLTTVKEQERYVSQTIPIPRGTRMAVNVLLDRKFINGEAEIVVPDLPPGVEQVAVKVAENASSAQLMLRAKEEAPIGGHLVDLTARLQDKAHPQGLVGHMDQRTQLVRGQNNRDVWGINSDKLAIGITEPVGFDIEVVQPQVPLVRDGTMPLQLKIKRQPGFTQSIRVRLLETPPGVTASTSTTIPGDKDIAEIPLTANSKASLGSWPVTVLATSKMGDNSTVVIASEFVDVEIADRLFDFQFSKTMAEVGQPARVKVGVKLLRPVDGQVEVEMVGLPPGTTMEKPKLPLPKDAQSLTYELKIPDNARPGLFKTIACRGLVSNDKGLITQVNGTGEVQIDVPRGEKGKTQAVASDDKPLSRLEELRKQREQSK